MYPSFANDPYAQSYLNDVDDSINPEECNHQNEGGLTRFRSADYFAVSDGRLSSQDPEELYRFADDIDEDLLLDDIVSIISRDAVMRSILSYANVPRPPKKLKIPRDVYPRKTSHELWNSIWGKRILSVRQEIAEIGVDHSTREQSKFRLDFRVPFSLFEDIVKDCKEAHIFTTGKKVPTISDEFKVLACLRILGRNYVTASVRTSWGCEDNY